MRDLHSLEALVAKRLRRRSRGRRAAAQSRPEDGTPASLAAGICASGLPRLLAPPGRRSRALPGTAWLGFSGPAERPCLDILTVAPAQARRLRTGWPDTSRPDESHPDESRPDRALLVVCPVVWLLARATPDDPTPRWKLTGLMRFAPTLPLVVPVRAVRAASEPDDVGAGSVLFPPDASALLVLLGVRAGACQGEGPLPAAAGRRPRRKAGSRCG